MHWLRGSPIDRETGVAPKALAPLADAPGDVHLAPSLMRGRAAAAAPRSLSWARAGLTDPLEWQEEARHRLAEIGGYGLFGGPPDERHRRDHGAAEDGVRHRSQFIRVRDGRDIPVRLVWTEASPPGTWPVMICLQGDGRAMDLSWGAPPWATASVPELAELDFARQAARRGFLAVCIELPDAGLRRDAGENGIAAAFAVGGGVLGEAASDVASVVNWLTQGDCGFPVVDHRIAVIGEGSGAMVAVLVAALDARICGVAAIGGIGPHRDAICRQGLPLRYVLPGLLQSMDMEDIVALCAPRPVLMQAAVDDPLWPAVDAERIAELAGAVYGRLGASQALTTQALPAGGRFDEARAWDWLAAALAQKSDDRREAG